MSDEITPTKNPKAKAKTSGKAKAAPKQSPAKVKTPAPSGQQRAMNDTSPHTSALHAIIAAASNQPGFEALINGQGKIETGFANGP